MSLAELCDSVVVEAIEISRELRQAIIKAKKEVDINELMRLSPALRLVEMLKREACKICINVSEAEDDFSLSQDEADEYAEKLSEIEAELRRLKAQIGL